MLKNNISCLDYFECTGCGACINVCPVNCISKVPNKGFFSTNVDSDNCINCGRCKKVCPSINGSNKPFLEVFVAQNTNKAIRMKSSSGGIFYLFAAEIIMKGGVVFGASINSQHEVEHIAIESISEINQILGSKYVQSNLNPVFPKLDKYLKDRRTILFCGTPCQCVAVNNYIGLKFNTIKSNVYYIDFICHGVGSPIYWKKYLARNFKKIQSISFRDKELGWKACAFSVNYLKNGKIQKKIWTSDNNPYMDSYGLNFNIRLSCFQCKFKGQRRCSDITLGDCWHFREKNGIVDDDTGISLIIVREKKILELLTRWQRIGEMQLEQYEYNNVVVDNPCIEKSIVYPKGKTIYDFLMKLGFPMRFCVNVSDVKGHLKLTLKGLINKF